MAQSVNDRILKLQIDTKKLKIEIEDLNKQGKTSKEVFDELKNKFEELVASAIKLADSSERSFNAKKKQDVKEYRDRLTKVNSALTSISSSYKSVANAAQQTNNEQLSGFKRLQALQEEIALRQIQLSKKTNDDKLRDVINYYKNVQQQYAVDSEEYLKYEKKKLDAEIKLQKSLEDSRLRKRKADVEAAVKSEKQEQERRADIQKRWDKRRESREKQESDKRKRIEDIEIQNSISKFKLEAAKHKQAEQQKTEQERKETKEREAIEKSRDFRGGFRAQLTPRAIGGALGSLTKYLGLYQAINAAQRLFTELTIGSVKQSIEFEKSLANLGAVAGATTEEVQMLGRNALDVAGSTKFTAQEIVTLQTELSKLGFTANDVVASTQAIAFTAQALGSPLAATAEQVGKVINQFDLLIEQADFVGDVLVTSINNSALSFDSFGTAIQYVGPIAKNLGLTLEQTAGAMAVLADNGFTASRIGTGLRGIFTELGKTSADVEKSLKNLAEQNISLSEAVDLVGKRNAAQLITLLKNIDAIDEGNSKYYQQGRALQSAAKQSDTLSGQMEILTSNFREFQIEIGNTIAQSNVLLGVLDAFFPKGAKTARAFKAINEIGFENFNKGAEEVIDGANATNKAIELLGITTEEYRKIVENAVISSRAEIFTSLSPTRLAKTRDEAIATKNTIDGLVEQLNKLAESRLKDNAITKGQEQAQNDFADSVKEVTSAFEQGINVNNKANNLFKTINKTIDEYQSIVDSGGTTVYNFIEGTYDLVRATDEEILKYKSAIQVLKGYQEQVQNSIISAKQLQEIFEDNRKKAVREEKQRIQDALRFADIEFENQVKRINELATLQKIRQQQILDSETATAEERTAAINRIADIEEQRQQDVSEAYKRKAVAISQITIEYEENEDAVDKALLKAKQFAEILDTNVVEDAANALKLFKAENDKLEKSFNDGEISIDEFNSGLQRNQDTYSDYINNLIESNNLGAEAEAILRGMVKGFNETSVSVKTASDEIDNAKKTFADFKKEFKKDVWADIAKQITDGIGEALDDFNKTAAENTKNRLDQELDAVANRYDIEAQILKSQLDNQLITESQYRLKQTELRKAQIAEENSLNRRIFEAEQKQDINNARIEGLEAAAQAYIEAFKEYEPATAFIVGSIGAGIAAAQSVAQIQAINQRKFFPKKFAEGGVVSGPSHDQGGVPFTVQGQAGYEMEGGEFVVNKRATAMHRDLLERINNSYRTRPTVGSLKFAEGGLVPSNPMAESVDYLKAIAEATTSTAIGVSKPVRAYVADKDLRSNATERRIRDRNDRL